MTDKLPRPKILNGETGGIEVNKIEQVKKILENKNISVSVSVLDYSKGEIKPAKDTF